MASSQAPAVPPRTSSQSLTPPPIGSANMIPSRRISQSRTPPPRISVPNTLHSSRRSSQSRTPPPRISAPNTLHSSRSSSQSRTPPPRNSAHNASTSIQCQSSLSPPPVPARWDMCGCHNGQKFTAVCLTCVKFLCHQCLFSEIYFHNQCSVIYLNDNLKEACRVLKQTVCEKIEKVSNTLNRFQTNLCKKRDRMLKKRNETISEIKNYYNGLREAIFSKLQKDEEKLLKMMKRKVDEQDGVILEKIQQCCATCGTLQDKNAVIQNFGNSDTNGIEHVKELVNAYDYIRQCDQVEKEVSAVRDAFLVIRFFVNSETEQIVLSSNVASVEVLNSQSNPRDRGTLESERINEVASLQAISNESVSTSHDSDADNRNATDVLRVALPPLNNQTPSRNGENSNTQNESATHSQVNERSENGNSNGRETQNSSVDIMSELINEFDARLGGTNDVSELSNEMILSNIQTNITPVSERSDAMSNISCNQQVSAHIDTDSGNVHNQVTERLSESGDRDNTENNSNADRRQSVAAIVSSEPTSQPQHNNMPNDDDPPPPYPGLLSSPEPPGLDELPPPYPGSGPPPPYSQMPEAQQPPGHNINTGGSSRDNCYNRLQARPASDSDLLHRPPEIAAPTQTSTPRMSRPKVSKAFSVNEANDRRVSGIFALMSVRTDAFLIVDRWNKKLKYFNANGESFGGLIFREDPWDITKLSDELVVVTVPKLNTFYKIKVTNNSVITTSTVPTLRSYACITFNKVTQLFICGQLPQFGEPVVDIVGVNGGQIIQTFRTGFNNELRFSYPRYIEMTDEDTAIVCDWNLKCLIVFKLDGTVVGRYRGTVDFPLIEPTGMSYNTSTKEIYVIDAKHSSTHSAIHIVNLNCRCREIVRWDNEFRFARAITAHASGYALGNKSGVLSIFAPRQRR